MRQVIINKNTGTEDKPEDIQFQGEDSQNALVVVAFTNKEVSVEYRRAIQDTIQGYLNDSIRNLECNTVQYCYNLPRPETGTGFVRMEIHTGYVSTEEQSDSV